MNESAGTVAVRETRALSTEIGATLTGAQLRYISTTEFVPKSMRGNLPAIAACVATGRALGLPDMTALRSINIIDGKASFSAELMVQLVRQRGHSITGAISPDRATVTGKRRDNNDEMTATFTIDDAKRANLLSKDNWKKYPESMLWARAVSQLCRMLFADCFAGATYTPEELGYGDVTADELMDETVAAEVVAVDDATIDEALTEQQSVAAEVPVNQTREQKDRLLELFAALADAKPETAWGDTLTAKIKKDYKAQSYNDLTGSQMAGLLEWLEGELAT